MRHGPALLLLNGIGASLDMLEPVARHLPGRRLIMLDLPGTGASPALRRPVRLPRYAAIALGLLDVLGVECTDVLGYSWGGALAQELAHRAPDRVSAVVLGATSTGLGGQPPAPWVLALMATPARRHHSATYLRLVSPLIFGSGPGGARDSAHVRARRRTPPSLVGYGQQLYAISGWSSRRCAADTERSGAGAGGRPRPARAAAQRPDPGPPEPPARNSTSSTAPICSCLSSPK